MDLCSVWQNAHSKMVLSKITTILCIVYMYVSAYIAYHNISITACRPLPTTSHIPTWAIFVFAPCDASAMRWEKVKWWKLVMCKSQHPTCLEIYTSTEREAGWAAAGESARSLHKGNSPSLRFTSSQRPYEGSHFPKCSCSEKQINRFIRFSQNRTTCGGSEWNLFVKMLCPSRFTRWCQSMLNCQ